MNAIISGSRDKMIGAVLYLYGWDVENGCEKNDPVPCSLCERMIVNAGIKEVIALNPLYKRGKNNCEPRIKHYSVEECYVNRDESLQYLIETAENNKLKGD
jgi:deoxycytidylate deaminase